MEETMKNPPIKDIARNVRRVRAHIRLGHIKVPDMTSKPPEPV